MARLSSRHGILLFMGGLDVFFGITFILYGIDSVVFFSHGAVGVAMWAGIGIVMIGLGNFLAVLTSTKTKRHTDGLDINLGSLLLNLVGMLQAAFIIGFYTWGAWTELQEGPVQTAIIVGSAVTYEEAISIYTTVILMAVLVFLLSLMAMFMDCCSYALFSRGPGDGDYAYGPHRQPGAMYDGPYEIPPPHMYKQ